MYNPLDTIRRFQSRIGKPVRPIIEVQKDCSIINIVTTSIQDGNLVRDTSRVEAWEIPVDSRAIPLYIDGIFKGMSYVAAEEGTIVELERNIDATDVKGNKITISYKGIIGKLLDAALLEMGSALKPSMMQTLIYVLLASTTAFMMGMSYG